MLHDIKPFRKLLMSSSLRYKFPKEIELDGSSLSLEKLSCLGSGKHQIKLNQNSILKIRSARKIVESIIEEKRPVYGFNTGFGQFSNICIENSNLQQLQYNLIRSHATGTGNLADLEQTRRTAILRVNTLVRGHSGISLETLNTLIKLINANIVSYMPCQGTVGASGDLVPLSHIALGIIGEGLLYNPNSRQYEDALKVLKEFKIEPAVLKAREGLSLINGTQFMTGVGSVALENSINLMRAVCAISALSFTALKGNPNEFDQRIGEIRPHPGQIAIAEIMRKLVPVGSILVNPHDVQSSYSLRCIPQVHGPTLEMIQYVKNTLEIEMNSTTDNPLLFEKGEPQFVSNGNFHGEYVAKALDILAIYVHELGNISYPRIMRLLNSSKSLGLNTFLTYEPGLSSGMMTYENVAAALVSENKVHCTPASIESLPTCADKEDHVSMGGYAARKAITVSENVGKILAVELMAATKAIFMRKEKEADFKIPKYLQSIYEKVIKLSPPFLKDRYSKQEYDQILEYIMSGRLWEDVFTEIETHCDVETINNDNKIKINNNDMDSQSKSSGKNKEANMIKLTPIPLNEKKHIIYTKERNNQIQIGESQDLVCSLIKNDEPITTEFLTEKLKAKKENSNNVFALVDLSQDDIGSRANFGRGHSSSLSPFKCFLEKLSNHPINRMNYDYINSLYLLGSLDLSDLLSECKDKNPNIPEERKTLISAVEEIDRRTQVICDAILATGSSVICLNGDNNNTLSLIASSYKNYKQKVVVIYLDIHSDCRDPNDGPHSGTWVTQGYNNNWIEKTFLVGFSELHNNETCVENLLKNKVEFRDYTCQKIQSGQTSIKSVVEDIINNVKTNYKDNPVVLCIDGDTVSGLPASAGNTVVGFPAFDVYPMIYRISSELNVKAYHIAELKPSLDATKESAVGEFLVQATYLFLKGSVDSKNSGTKF
jgi:histidine ammonia-lyase